MSMSIVRLCHLQRCVIFDWQGQDWKISWLNSVLERYIFNENAVKKNITLKQRIRVQIYLEIGRDNWIYSQRFLFVADSYTFVSLFNLSNFLLTDTPDECRDLPTVWRQMRFFISSLTDIWKMRKWYNIMYHKKWHVTRIV